MKNSHKFFSNTDCQYYPCHNMENQNCLFCFCPLFVRGCPYDWSLRDCQRCTFPHKAGSFDKIISILKKEYRDAKKLIEEADREKN